MDKYISFCELAAKELKIDKTVSYLPYHLASI